MPRRRDADVKPFLPIWRKESRDVYYTTQNELKKVVSESKLSESDLKNKMGQGYTLLLKALDGQKMTDYEVRFIEGALGQIRISNPIGNTLSLGERLTSKYPGK
ncbi:MAG: hypothetical protein JNM24_17495 [Bdellovibrionaceae bacterium]|nr:hypothetical protein [Pseudobdellovibrionaceae bacterium]